MLERDPLVENEAFAPPQALGLRDAFEIVQYAAAQLQDVREAFRQ
jgi:hypothetical protein